MHCPRIETLQLQRFENLSDSFWSWEGYVGIPLVHFIKDATYTHTLEIIISTVYSTVKFHRSGSMPRRRSTILCGGKGISAYLRKGAAD